MKNEEKEVRGGGMSHQDKDELFLNFDIEFVLNKQFVEKWNKKEILTNLRLNSLLYIS